MAPPDRGEDDQYIPSDVLDEIIARVSTLDLVAASLVSKPWRRSVLSSLRRRIPLLVVHLQRPHLIRVFDPQSLTWSSLPPPTSRPAALRSSSPSLLHSLSRSSLAFSTDPFGAFWRRVRPPSTTSALPPTVALVGTRLVVICADDSGSCRVYNLACPAAGWVDCQPLPDNLRNPRRHILSAAASDRVLYLMDTFSNWLCSFDPAARQWGSVRRIRLHYSVYSSAIALAGGRLILAAAAGATKEDFVDSIKIWELGRSAEDVRVIGRMPTRMVGKLMGDDWVNAWDRGSSPVIGFAAVGDFGYIYNPTDPSTEVVLVEIREDGCRWTSAGSVAGIGENLKAHSMVARCSEVRLDDLVPAATLSRPGHANSWFWSIVDFLFF